METDIPMEDKSPVMQKLLDEHADLVSIPEKGEIVTGHVLEKSRNALYLDLGTLGVGIIFGRELFDDMDTYKSAKIGDPVQATIEILENGDGYVELSLRSASQERSWEELRRKLKSGDLFLVEILDANKGGLIVRVNGIMGFLPVSQLAPDHYPRVEGGDKNQILQRLKSYVGENFKVKLITALQDEEKLIVSEKAAIGDELSETLEKLSIGTTIEGVVSGVADFGAFVKFTTDGKELEGLVHISELAWQRIDDPTDIVQAGEHVEAKVIGVDGLRISLSIKQLREDPWKNVTAKYNIGDIVKGEVLKVTPFGGFIKLDDDIHGLVHISELPKEMQATPEKVLTAGEKVEFKIISLDPTEHRLGLSIQALTTPAADLAAEASAKEAEKTDEKTEKAKPAKKPRKTAAKKTTKKTIKKEKPEEEK
jgi:small subunit ribosomal protein S1